MIDKNLASAIANTIGPMIRTYSAKALATVSQQIHDLEERVKAIPAGPKGDSIKGDKGDAAEIDYGRVEELVASSVSAAVVKAVSELPPAKPGKDADPIPPETIQRMVSDEVGKAVAGIVLPVPENGKDADPMVIASMVEKAVAALPPAKDGKPGKDGESIRGEKGIDGKDGSTLIVGEGPPMFAAKAGDVYLDSLSGDIYNVTDVS